MAYSYSAIDDLMGQQPQKQDIFSANAPAGQGQSAASGTQPDASLKTSTEGEIGAGGGGSTPVAQAQPKQVSDTGTTAQKTQQAAYKANIGKTQTPGALSKLQAQIGTAQSGLQQQAADYAAQQASKQNYALSQDVAKKAIEDQAATAERGQLSGLLGRGAAEQVEQFNPQNVSVNTDLLSSPAGIKQLVAQGRRPTYMGNMAAFDAMLLQANPEFQRQSQEIQAQNAALRQNVQSTQTSAEQAAQAAAAANLQASQEDIKKYLAGYQGNITAEQQAAAAAANAALPGQIEAQRAKVQADLIADQRRRAQAALDAQFGTGRASSQLAAQEVDPSQYIDFIKGYDPSQFVTQTQAERFNRIQSLLGAGGQTQVAAQGLPDLYTTRGEDLYNKLVGGATQARQTQDIASRQQLADIQAQAEKAAAADNARRLGLTQSYGKDVTSMANQLLKEQLASDPAARAGFYKYTPELQSAVDQALQGYLQNKPAASYNTLANPKLLGQEMYSKEQADELNALAKDLGLPQVYQAGQYQKGGAQSLVNREDLQKLISGTVGSYRDAQKAKMDEDRTLQNAIENVRNSPMFGSRQGSMIPSPTDALAAGLNKGVEGYRNPLATIRNPNPFA